MFNNKLKKSSQGEPKTGTVNIVGLGTSIKGDLITNGDIRIDGEIFGEVNSKAKVVIGSSGAIIGNVIANSAEISGVVEGNIRIEEILFLKSTAVVNGDILSDKLVIENGANFTGYCKTAGATQAKSISINEVSA